VRVEARLELDRTLDRSAIVETLTPIGAELLSVFDASRDVATNRSRLYLTVKLRREDLEYALMNRLTVLEGVRRVEIQGSTD
jgi:hypothetical protein